MINLVDIPFAQVSLIKELWEKNRIYHRDISENFGDLYDEISFEERINNLNIFDEQQLKITIAEEPISSQIVGYCISTLKETMGETLTLHVDEKHRNSGIGKKLMESHINWLKKNGCKTIVITVAVENYSTIEFYKSLGFKANTLEMRLV